MEATSKAAHHEAVEHIRGELDVAVDCLAKTAGAFADSSDVQAQRALPMLLFAATASAAAQASIVRN